MPPKLRGMLFRKPLRSIPTDADVACQPDVPRTTAPIVAPCVDAVLTASIEVLCERSSATTDPLHGELLGSDASGIWWVPSCAHGAPGCEFERQIGVAYATALDRRGGADALAALRALQAGAAPGIAAAVGPTAERMAARGYADPPWWRRAGGLRARRAAEMSGDDDAHRTRIVLVELERGGVPMALGVLTDAAAAGAAASIAVFEGLDPVRETLRAAGPPVDELIRPLPVPDARRTVLRAIERTDLLGTSERHGPGFVGFRALALRWMAAIAADADGQAA